MKAEIKEALRQLLARAAQLQAERWAIERAMERLANREFDYSERVIKDIAFSINQWPFYVTVTDDAVEALLQDERRDY